MPGQTRVLVPRRRKRIAVASGIPINFNSSESFYEMNAARRVSEALPSGELVRSGGKWRPPAWLRRLTRDSGRTVAVQETGGLRSFRLGMDTGVAIFRRFPPTSSRRARASDAGDIARLEGVLDELHRFLVEHPENGDASSWASRVARCARDLRARKLAGLQGVLLLCRGGMGSFMDVVYTPKNGNARDRDEGAALTARLTALQAEAQLLAKRIYREHRDD